MLRTYTSVRPLMLAQFLSVYRFIVRGFLSSERYPLLRQGSQQYLRSDDGTLPMYAMTRLKSPLSRARVVPNLLSWMRIRIYANCAFTAIMALVFNHVIASFYCTCDMHGDYLMIYCHICLFTLSPTEKDTKG